MSRKQTKFIYLVHIFLIFASRTGAPRLENVTQWPCSGPLQIQKHMPRLLTHRGDGMHESPQGKLLLTVVSTGRGVRVTNHVCETLFDFLCLWEGESQNTKASLMPVAYKNNVTIYTRYSRYIIITYIPRGTSHDTSSITNIYHPPPNTEQYIGRFF